MSFLASVVTGIISGLLTSTVTFLFYKFYLHVLKPWYARTIYKGVNISGTWRGGVKRGNDEEIKAVFNIEQDAFNVEGVFYAETIHNGRSENYSNQYKFIGKIRNNTAIINYETISDKRTGMGTLMLEAYKGGNILKGRLIHSENSGSMFSENNFEIKRD